jgi:hypothetical protein
MKTVGAVKKGGKANRIRDYFRLAYAEKCYLSKKTVNLVMRPESALVLAERVLSAVNAGKKKIDLRVYAPNKGVIESGKRAGITVTSPKK